MKLLKLKIESEKGFKSLPKNFEIKFNDLNNVDALEQFQPFCFAGINGSGKSNVLEALSSIFYHLEFCVAIYQPNNFRKHFSRINSNPNAYTIEYLIAEKDSPIVGVESLYKVIINKKSNLEPTMEVESSASWMNKENQKKRISLAPSIHNNQSAPGKRFLPDNIVAYSSGENETLSLPYIKCRLVHFDEYMYSIENGIKEYKEPENSFIYIDRNMSQAVLLSNLIFEEVTTKDISGKEKDGALKSFAEEVKITGMQCFSMNLNLASLDHKISSAKVDTYDKYFKKNFKGELTILQLLVEKIKELKNCATCHFEDEQYLKLDFIVNADTKKAFKSYFANSFELFQLFRLLYELNAYTVDEETKEDIYKSNGFYTDWKLPDLMPKDNIFAFTDFFVLKKVPYSSVPKPLLLKELSDGEHQFIHTMGICLMLKLRRALLLLDEPETHFNPGWRAKFIKVLNDSINLSGNDEQNFSLHILKDVLLTSHSPFIISDCMPNNVILFKKDIEGKISTKTAKQLGFNTYGASVDLILQEIFEMSNSISEHALEEIKMLLRKRSPDKIIEGALKFGESYEKGFLYEKIERLKLKTKNQKSR